MRQPAPAVDAAALGFRALSDPTRLAILGNLSGGERCVCDIQTDLDLSQPLLSFHLRVLREAGLVRSRKAGRWAYYAIEPAGLKVLQQQLEQLHQAAERSLPIQLEA
jgi:ArsR family transcriptional regulator